MTRRVHVSGVSLAAVLCFVLASHCLAQADKNAAAKFTREQRKELDALAEKFGKAGAADNRADLVGRMSAIGPKGVRTVKGLVDRQVAVRATKYIRLLRGYVRPAYVKRLETLTDEQIYQVQMTRRLWKFYLLTTGMQYKFQDNFLKPCAEMAQTLLIRIEDVTDETVVAQRRVLLEFGDYQTQCNTSLGIDPDPTKGKISTTGIAYPNLDSPPTFRTRLSYLERTLVLAHSVAPPGAVPALMTTAERAAEIDVEEAEFVMFGNEVRMLTGTIAWVVDPVVCACTRDHSTDRKEGRASGHSSTIPEKKSFTMRLKRFGATGRSEGAGGGRNGRGYIHGLSYGGGHTGPLYSLKRNVVGVGRRGGVYTSVYRTDKEWIHPCAVTAGELFMPPGLGYRDIKASALRTIYRHMKSGSFGRAHAMLAKVKARTDHDKMMLRFFTAAVQVEVDWFFSGITRIENVGDVYTARSFLAPAKRAFAAMASFQERIAPFAQRLNHEDLAAEIKAGAAYRRITSGQYNGRTLRAFIADHKGTVYAAAAEHLVGASKDADKPPHPLSYFMTKDKTLNQFGYLASP